MTYLETFKTKDSGNGYVIVNAPNARVADAVCRGLSRFSNLPDFKILSIEEFHTHEGCETGVIAEGITSAPESLYDIAVRLGFIGSESDFIESLKGEKGKDGKDFKFEDFTPEQIELLKNGPIGPVGPRGYSIRGIKKINYANNTSFYQIESEDGNIIGTFQVKDGDKGRLGDKGELGIQGELGLQGEKGEDGNDAFSYNYYVTPMHLRNDGTSCALTILAFIECFIGRIPILPVLNTNNITLSDSTEILSLGQVISSDYKNTILEFSIEDGHIVDYNKPVLINIEVLTPDRFNKSIYVPLSIEGILGVPGNVSFDELTLSQRDSLRLRYDSLTEEEKAEYRQPLELYVEEATRMAENAEASAINSASSSSYANILATNAKKLAERAEAAVTKALAEATNSALSAKDSAKAAQETKQSADLVAASALEANNKYDQAVEVAHSTIIETLDKFNLILLALLNPSEDTSVEASLLGRVAALEQELSLLKTTKPTISISLKEWNALTSNGEDFRLCKPDCYYAIYENTIEDIESNSSYDPSTGILTLSGIYDVNTHILHLNGEYNIETRNLIL